LAGSAESTAFYPCRSLQKEAAAQEKAALAVVAKAKAMAIALQTIGKFIIKKNVGESNQIFGRWVVPSCWHLPNDTLYDRMVGTMTELRRVL